MIQRMATSIPDDARDAPKATIRTSEEGPVNPQRLVFLRNVRFISQPGPMPYESMGSSNTGVVFYRALKRPHWACSRWTLPDAVFCQCQDRRSCSPRGEGAARRSL